ncbi:cytochrome C oxidase subunit IV family protein [Planctomicrobium sp. SH527]|uniref:cytochrome C oxidase subunit IV family protein n=1 Tax=Planctomicrobium sp. SH527 TaxID=3448123 RepID=UPI003F5BE770
MAHHSHVKSYLVVYFILLVLVAATVAVAMIPLGSLAFPIAFGIAVFKALLIILIFMHVKDESNLVKIFAFVSFPWLGILFCFMFADYLTRDVSMPIEREQQRAIAIESVKKAREHGHGASGDHGSSGHGADSHGGH